MRREVAPGTLEMIPRSVRFGLWKLHGEREGHLNRIDFPSPLRHLEIMMLPSSSWSHGMESALESCLSFWNGVSLGTPPWLGVHEVHPAAPPPPPQPLTDQRRRGSLILCHSRSSAPSGPPLTSESGRRAAEQGKKLRPERLTATSRQGCCTQSQARGPSPGRFLLQAENRHEMVFSAL